MKEKIKVGTILQDKANYQYEVIEKLKNSVVIADFPNFVNMSCIIMTYYAMEQEGWKIINQAYDI